jgi:hypothetical protein
MVLSKGVPFNLASIFLGMAERSMASEHISFYISSFSKSDKWYLLGEPRQLQKLVTNNARIFDLEI